MRCDLFLSSFGELRSKFLNIFFSLSFKNLSMTREYHKLSILVIFNKYFSRLLQSSSVFTLITLEMEVISHTSYSMKHVIITTYCRNIQESNSCDYIYCKRSVNADIFDDVIIVPINQKFEYMQE